MCGGRRSWGFGIGGVGDRRRDEGLLVAFGFRRCGCRSQVEDDLSVLRLEILEGGSFARWMSTKDVVVTTWEVHRA
jgi:hypothetical protein